MPSPLQFPPLIRVRVMINGHGDDGFQYPKITANFSSNVYHGLDLTELRHYLSKHIATIHSYPEPDANSLMQLLAKEYAITVDNISISNGATEAIYLIAQAFRGSKTTIVAPVFSEYADACTIHQHQLQHVFRLADIPLDCELCWICNPNNPTGEVYPLEQLWQLIEQQPHTCFVIDQSYAAFAKGATLAIAQASQYPNLILLHSMTKQYAIAGLRLGYITAHADILERINYFKMPWAVNSLAIMAGQYLLTHQAQLKMDLTALLGHSKQLQQQLATLEGLEVLPSQTHYFLGRLLNGRSAAKLKAYLAHKHYLLIRDAANFVGLDQAYFRVACQSVAENQQLVSAIRHWLEGEG